ncbi:DUF3078 domain-containing protein [Pseudofulvibacter geojedonensis]|uniref:DUF3078 domain-containing protein n=1 Tax=Pseudofulvibacter geojedonensis TaxID=1123758 RepID=A0ABW3I3E5_9FLAO
MKKVVLALAFAMATFVGFAQEKAAKDSVTEGWKRAGNVLITFNQSAFNKEWTGGGVGNTAANILVNYDINYKKGDWIWDNKIIADYGVNKNKGAERFTKNNDRLEFNSTAGKKASNNWYYSAYFNLRTQMDAGSVSFVNDNNTPLDTSDDFNQDITTSHFFSPAYFQAGPGMLWKKSDNLFVNISPAAAKMIMVHKHFTEFGDAFGVEKGDAIRFELGAAVRGYAKFDIMKNISVENILALYTNYLEDPQNVDIDYTMNLAMQVNKYISANLVFQAIYDDNAQPKGFQIREAFGLGFNYAF